MLKKDKNSLKSIDTPYWIKILPKPIRNRLSKRQVLTAIISNTGWLFIERIVRMFIGAIVGIFIARYLGPGKLGIINYAISFIAMAVAFADLGLEGIVVKDIVNNIEQKSIIMGTAFFLKLFSGFFCFFIIFIIIIFTKADDTQVQIILTIISTRLIFQAFNVIQLWFQSQMQAKYYVLALNLALIISSLGQITFIVINGPVIAFAGIYAAEFLIIALVLSIYYRMNGQEMSKWRFRFNKAKDLLKQSWPLILSSFAAIIYLRIDQVMLGDMIGSKEVGIYSVAAQLSEIWYFIPAAIATSAFPALINNKKKNELIYKKNLQQLYDFMFLIALALAIPITFIGTPIIKILYGTEYAAAGPILSIHIWAACFIFIRAVFSKWLIMEKLFIFSFVTHCAGAVMNIILNLILIPGYKGIGAAIATVVSYATASYFATFLHPKSWPACKMMTKAIFSPVRLMLKLIWRS